MDPYYSYMNTFGPVNEGAGVDRGMHQFFGSMEPRTDQATRSTHKRTTMWTDPYYDRNTFFGAAGNGAPKTYKRVTLWEIATQNQHLNLYGKGIGEAGTNAAAATAGGATVAFFSGAIITGLALSYAVGRFVGAPAIEYFSGNKLTDKQKNAVGIVTMIF